MARVRLEKSMNWVHHGVAPSPPTFLGGFFTHGVNGPATEVAMYPVEQLKKAWLFRLYRGLYYPIIWGFS